MTKAAENGKARDKGALAKGKRLELITIALNTHAGIGDEGATFLWKLSETKSASAKSDAERWRAQQERMWLLAEMACAVARRNCAIMNKGAFPKRGGMCPPVRMQDGETDYEA